VRNLNFTVTSSSGDAKITIPQFGGNAFFAAQLYKLTNIGGYPFGWNTNEDDGISYSTFDSYAASDLDSSLAGTAAGNNRTMTRGVAKLTPGTYRLRMTFQEATELANYYSSGGRNAATVSGSMTLATIGNKVWSGVPPGNQGFGGNRSYAGIGTDTLVGTGLPSSSAIRQFAIETRSSNRSNRENLNLTNPLQIGSGSKTLTFNRISGTQSDILLNLNAGSYSANGWSEGEDGDWTTTNLSSATSITLQSATTTINVLRAVGPTSGTNAERIHTIEFILS
jgi:hypothetical protein